MIAEIMRFIIILFLTVPFLVSSQQVKLYEDFTQAKNESAQSGKPLMVFVKAEWCGYCKYTREVVFKTDTAADYLNEKYICVMIDEKSIEGKKLKREHNISVLPAYLFFKSDGKLIHKREGFITAAKLKDVAQRSESGKIRFRWPGND